MVSELGVSDSSAGSRLIVRRHGIETFAKSHHGRLIAEYTASIVEFRIVHVVRCTQVEHVF